MNDVTFLQERINKAKALIAAYEEALLALGSGVQSFKLDTGQTVESVTELDLDRLNATVDGLYNRCATLEARLNGANVIGRPAW